MQLSLKYSTESRLNYVKGLIEPKIEIKEEYIDLHGSPQPEASNTIHALDIQAALSVPPPVPPGPPGNLDVESSLKEQRASSAPAPVPVENDGMLVVQCITEPHGAQGIALTQIILEPHYSIITTLHPSF